MIERESIRVRLDDVLLNHALAYIESQYPVLTLEKEAQNPTGTVIAMARYVSEPARGRP
jgi:hypothetical protein